MQINLRNDKLVELSTTKQWEESIKMFGSTYDYAVKTPEEPHLWESNDNAERLDTEKAKLFQSVAAKLLYVTKRTRLYIEPEVAYFTTRVANSNVEDWKKMKCFITFLKQSKEDKTNQMLELKVIIYLGRRVVLCASKYVKSYSTSYVCGIWTVSLSFKQAEIEYKKYNWIRACWYKWIRYIQYMDGNVLWGTRVWDNAKRIISR